MKNKSYKKKGFFTIFLLQLYACMYSTRHEFCMVPLNVVEFFFSKHRGNQKVSVPLMSHLYPWWKVDFFLSKGFNFF